METDENFSKSNLISQQILALKTLWIVTKYVLKNYILFLVIDATLASNNPSRFIDANLALDKSSQLLHDNWWLNLDGKTQYNIQTEAAKIAALSFRVKDKYEILTGE